MVMLLKDSNVIILIGQNSPVYISPVYPQIFGVSKLTPVTEVFVD